MSANFRTRGDRAFEVVNYILLTIILILVAYPIYFTIIASVSDPYAVTRGEVILFPKGFTWDAYANAFKESSIWMGYKNTLFYTVVGVALSLIMIIPAGYVLSKNELPGHVVLTFYFLITMYFNGGLIPSYLNAKNLGLINTVWAIVLLGGLSVYNVIVTRSFFVGSIPKELYESAYIDGADEFTNFFKIALPLCKPILAVMALFCMVTRWNDYYTAMIYTSKTSMQPLQTVLRNILLLNQTALGSIDQSTATEEDFILAAHQAYMAEAMKYSVIFIASAPLLIVYPFVQKYFVKGVMIGSVKG